MSCGCNETKSEKKGMTRGEFIGVGAAAAATLGTVGVAVGRGAARAPGPCA